MIGVINIGKVVPVNCNIHKIVSAWGTFGFDDKTSVIAFNPYFALIKIRPIAEPNISSPISKPIRIKNCNPGVICL